MFSSKPTTKRSRRRPNNYSLLLPLFVTFFTTQWILRPTAEASPRTPTPLPPLFLKIAPFINFNCTLVTINLLENAYYTTTNKSTKEILLDSLLITLQTSFYSPAVVLNQTPRAAAAEGTCQRPTLRQSNCFQVLLLLTTTPDGNNTQLPSLTRSLMTLITPNDPFLIPNADTLLVISTTSFSSLSSTFASSHFVNSFKFRVGLLLPDPHQLSPFSSCNFCSLSTTGSLLFPITKPPPLQGKHIWVDYESNMNLHSLRLTASLTTRTRFNFTLISDQVYRPTTGILVHFLSYLQQNLNFTFTISPVGTTGVPLPNGSWTGAVSHILAGNADMAMCIAETYQRAWAAEFTPTIFYEPVTLISGHPNRVFVWYAVLWPLSPIVWTLILITSALSIAVLILQVHTTKTIQWERGRIVEYVLGSFLGQFSSQPTRIRRNHHNLQVDSYEIPPPILMFLTFWLLTSFIITTIYLTMLVGFLTFPVLEKIPETGEELARDTHYSIGITYLGGALSSLLRTSKVPMMINLANRMELTDAFQCIRKPTKNSKYICIGYEIIAKTFINTEGLLTPDGGTRLQKKPPIQIHPNHLFAVGAGILLPKRSPLAPNVAHSVGSTLSAGLVPQWERSDFRKLRLKVISSHASKKNTPSNGKDDDNQDILTFRHLHGAYILLIAGLSLSLVGLGVELIYAKTHTTPLPSLGSLFLVPIHRKWNISKAT